MTESERKRTRTPSDPVATATAIVARMSPDMLDALGAALLEAAPRSAAILADALTAPRGPV